MKSRNILYLFVNILFSAFLAASCATPAPPQVKTTTSTSSTFLSPTQTSTHTMSSEDNWPTYHRDISRSGLDLNTSLNGQTHRLWSSDSLDGDIYAEPLIVGGRVLVATEQNTVYSIDTSTGKIQWHVNLGSPVPLSELGCGDIDPSGITGTPVADPSTNRLYVVARIEPNHHELFVIDINTGNVISHKIIDPPGSDPRVQQQRSALTLSHGRIYVAFGGLYGDCGSYYGWVVSMSVDENGPLAVYRVSSHRGAGLWAPSGPAIDNNGNIYVTSGNAFSGSTFDYGNSVVRLTTDLTLADWFSPDNWQELDSADLDLGSMGPIPLNGSLIFQAGKDGKGYLLQSDNLGHIGGELFSGPIGDSAFGGAAYSSPYIFIPCTNGLLALRIDSRPSFSIAWSSADFFAGPPVVAGDTVLTVDINSGTLYAFGVNDGKLVFKIPLGHVVHFTTPSLSQGHIFVAADRQIICLGR
jgi:outer membrane protein assembly factor BamB